MRLGGRLSGGEQRLGRGGRHVDLPEQDGGGTFLGGGEGAVERGERGGDLFAGLRDLVIDHALIAFSERGVGGHAVFDQFRADQVGAMNGKRVGIIEDLARCGVERIGPAQGLIAQAFGEIARRGAQRGGAAVGGGDGVKRGRGAGVRDLMPRTERVDQAFGIGPEPVRRQEKAKRDRQKRGETGGGNGGKAVERQRQADAERKGHGGGDRQGSKDIGTARGVHRRT